ncbi:glycerate kinase [Chloroflexota bacterium]
MPIKNQDKLATTELRRQALKIIEAGIERVLPATIMKSTVNYNPESSCLEVGNAKYRAVEGRIFVIGGGKASGLMAEALEDKIGVNNILTGIVNCKGGNYSTKRIKVIEAGHPIPDKRGLNGVKQMLALKDKYSINNNDLVVCLISGGGSALMPFPVDGISLKDKQEATQLLLNCSAEIHEINKVRKHLSKIKGGRLGEFYSPAEVVSLIISDVMGNDIDAIASGPTYPDYSTFQDAYNVLKKYDLTASVPEKVLSHLERGCHGEVAETPKHLTNCHNHIIGNNRLALEAMATKAEELGFTPLIITAEQKGDTAEAAYARAGEILKGKYQNYNAILIGGETTPKLPENAGKGGRNQHYAAVSMLAMRSYPGHWLAASVGTDGSDYLHDVAGAIVDNNTLLRATSRGTDIKAYIDRFDSNTLFKKIGETLIMTGNTGTNVSDVMLYLLM